MAELAMKQEDPRTPDVTALLRAHLQFAAEQSPEEHVHALDIGGLLDESVTFFSARDDGLLLGVGALKMLDDSHGELKSIHTAERARGRGVGRAVVDHLVDVARGRGVTRLSLETGTMEAFAPSRALYKSVGFEVSEPFGDYWENEYSVCMTMELA